MKSEMKEDTSDFWILQGDHFKIEQITLNNKYALGLSQHHTHSTDAWTKLNVTLQLKTSACVNSHIMVIKCIEAKEIPT
jgi:hypothetical protein